jgi:hypothetical protein
MSCTLSDNKVIKDNKEINSTLSDKAQECITNPTVIIFKEF